MWRWAPVLLLLLVGGMGMVGAGERAKRQAMVERYEKKMAARRARLAPSVAEHRELGGRQVDIWRPKAASGAVPLILFSHGWGGCGTQSAFLTRALADAGYLVVAPNHADARCAGDSWSPHRGIDRPAEPFRAPDRWTDATYADRRDDMRAVLAAVLADPTLHADPARIGLLGHSLGGYTVLGLSGAWPSWKMAGVKAVVALAPYCLPFVVKGAMVGATPPVEFQGGARDHGITPGISKPGGCYDAAPPPAAFVEFRNAGHYAWTQLLDTADASIIRYTRAYFDHYVRGDPAPAVPAQAGDVSEQRVK